MPNFAAGLYFADGCSVTFTDGQTEEQELQALALLQAKIALGH